MINFISPSLTSALVLYNIQHIIYIFVYFYTYRIVHSYKVNTHFGNGWQICFI